MRIRWANGMQAQFISTHRYLEGFGQVCGQETYAKFKHLTSFWLKVNVLKIPTQPRVDCWLGYEGTNITGEKVVNPDQTQLNDALIESYERLWTSHDEDRLFDV
jgi:hypothetical protein